MIRRLPKLDIVRIQDVGLIHADDPSILEWAANEQGSQPDEYEGQILFIPFP